MKPKEINYTDKVLTLTVEEYFSGIALQGLIAASNNDVTMLSPDEFDNWQNLICEKACIMGSEMINKLNQRNVEFFEEKD